MKTGSRAEGFTIVETLIVMAVTGSMLFMAVLAISGRQAKTEFTQGVGNFQQQLEQNINEVGNGYYPNNNDLSCSGISGSPVVRTGITEQGKNEDCIFLGKVMQFDVDDGLPEQTFNVYTMVGLRKKITSTGLTLNDVKPRVIAPSTSDMATPAAFDTRRMPYGQDVAFVRYRNAGTTLPVGSVGFYSSLGKLDSSNQNQQVNLIAIPGTNLNRTQTAEANTINDRLDTSIVNPDGGIEICVNSGGTAESALFKVGGKGRQTTVSVDMKQGAGCP